ncbi:TRAP transporter small permease [Alkalibacter mobilis]|uniref:TRAP transporter small permease n=1 Tax=Alkalibacter mobilis TaxID=2787712 RepID=UPI0018A08956|nr:TRAP transporter small permease [Alkalibacter mobilis]MBF7095634.1 TRAP transporter small permease [Alkalibacter mobilis]
MKKLDEILMKILYIVCAGLMFMMAAVIFAQVVFRYVVGSSLTWSEELGRYIFVWMSFLGMTVAMKKGSHVALDVLVQYLKGVSQKTLMVLNNLLVGFFGSVLFYSGYKLVSLGVGQKSPTLGIPMQYLYTVIPVSGIILVYFVISQTLQMFAKGDDING